MKKSKLLDDEAYNTEIERLSNLPKGPQAEPAKKEYRRTLRRISETDVDFLRRLITDVVDTNETCPTPAELIRRAGEMRALAVKKSLGSPDCEVCHGSGWHSFTRRVKVGGLAAYDAEFAEPCVCRGGPNGSN